MSPTLQIPATGTYTVDRTHSTATFAVKHMVVSNFRSSFGDFDARLRINDGELQFEGSVRVDSIAIEDPQLKGHVLSPDFFDAEAHPEIRYVSTSAVLDGDELVLEGDLTIAGHTERVQARGPFNYIEADIAGGERIGVELTTTIDRRAYGLDWNAPLPKGGFALGNDVTLTIHLELTPEA